MFILNQKFLKSPFDTFTYYFHITDFLNSANSKGFEINIVGDETMLNGNNYVLKTGSPYHWLSRLRDHLDDIGETRIFIDAYTENDIAVGIKFTSYDDNVYPKVNHVTNWENVAANFSFTSEKAVFEPLTTSLKTAAANKLDYIAVDNTAFDRHSESSIYFWGCLVPDNAAVIAAESCTLAQIDAFYGSHIAAGDSNSIANLNFLTRLGDVDRHAGGVYQMLYSRSSIAEKAVYGVSVTTIPTVEKWTISSITAGADGTTATIATSITPMPGGGTPDVTVVLQVGTNGVNYAPIANGLTGLTPGVAVTVYVTDQFGGVRTMAFTPEPLPVPEPVYPNVTFADRDQQTIIPVEVNNPIGTDLLRAILQITFPALSKTLTRSLPVSGAVQFDINNALWGELVGRMEGDAMSFFAFPTDPDAIAINRIDTHTLAFTLEEGYSYVDENMDVQQVITTTNAQDPQYAGWRCLYGGAARHLNSYLKSINSTLYAYFAGGALMRFLTWMPNNTPMHPRQPQRLWLFNFGKFAAGKVMAQITWSDGIQSAAINCADLPGDLALWEIAVGADELRLHNVDVTKTVASYSVWVQDANNVKVTETRSFVLDNNYYRRNDVLFFRNSLGVHETIWLHGIREDNDDMSRDESLRPMAAQSTYRGSLVNARATVSHTYKMNSGYIPKRLRQWTTDFLTSRDVVMPIGLYMVPISITQSKADKGDDIDDLFFFSFTAKIAHAETHYSPFPEVPSPWGDFNNDFNQDYFI